MGNDVDTKQIQQEVFAATQEAYEKAGFTSKKIARELALIAFADMKDFVQVDEQGSVKPISFNELKKKSRCIKKIREKRRILNSNDDDTILDDTFEFELYSKLEALSIAIDILGIKKPQQITGSVTLNHELPEDVQDIFEKIYAKAE